MKILLPVIAGALVTGASFPVLADQPVGAMHPEESIPNNLPKLTSPGPYSDFYKQLQQKLNTLGFDAGPVNGDFSAKTQAALAQYQLAMMLPASGMPDAPTLLQLDLQTPDLEANASPGDSAAAGGTR